MAAKSLAVSSANISDGPGTGLAATRRPAAQASSKTNATPRQFRRAARLRPPIHMAGMYTRILRSFAGAGSKGAPKLSALAQADCRSNPLGGGPCKAERSGRHSKAPDMTKRGRREVVSLCAPNHTQLLEVHKRPPGGKFVGAIICEIVV